ncbi:MAG: AAA family ATPase [Deltaproteobacteria bacterium]|jgi:DNA repair protein RecN (Recombination protein N)|nr:AAA family ATPase [Deltaproteobacteria bacterium]
MLEYLRIRDLALIQDMELEFRAGMNVLTGETGAGKSFIIKALGFLMGDRLGQDMVRPGAERALVEAVFSLGGEELVLRRELAAESGRSRFHMNDRLCSQESARELRSSLLLHTTQHGQQKLLQPGFQAALVDAALDSPALLHDRDELLKEWRENHAEGERLRARQESLAARRELLEMQQREIDKVSPRPGEEEELEAKRVHAREQAGLAAEYENALNLIYNEEGFASALRRLERALERLAAQDDFFAGTLDAVVKLREQIPELERRLRRAPAAVSPRETDALEARLYALAQLKRKLRRSLGEIIALRGEIEENLSFLDACALENKQLEAKDRALRERLGALLQKLVPARRAAAERFARRLEQELVGLGFAEELRVEADFSPLELTPPGRTSPACVDERARLLWAPNPGQAPQPLDRIASGGELSRFLLALVGIQAEEEQATLIFDEVDAGIGGLTLTRLADRLDALASKRQVLLITHWPQLAARAHRHFYVSKEVRNSETFTLCTQLNPEAVKKELERMAPVVRTMPEASPRPV